MKKLILAGLAAALAVSPATVQAQLATFEVRFDALESTLATLEDRNRPPPAAQRLWIPAIALVAGAYYGSQALAAHKVGSRGTNGRGKGPGLNTARGVPAPQDPTREVAPIGGRSSSQTGWPTP